MCTLLLDFWSRSRKPSQRCAISCLRSSAPSSGPMIGSECAMQMRGVKLSALLLMSLLLALATSCATPRTLNNVDRLIARPDFNAAAQAAPDWVRDALYTITDLEYELESK